MASARKILQLIRKEEVDGGDLWGLCVGSENGNLTSLRTISSPVPTWYKAKLVSVYLIFFRIQIRSFRVTSEKNMMALWSEAQLYFIFITLKLLRDKNITCLSFFLCLFSYFFLKDSTDNRMGVSKFPTKRKEKKSQSGNYYVSHSPLECTHIHTLIQYLKLSIISITWEKN